MDGGSLVGVTQDGAIMVNGVVYSWGEPRWLILVSGELT